MSQTFIFFSADYKSSSHCLGLVFESCLWVVTYAKQVCDVDVEKLEEEKSCI